VGLVHDYDYVYVYVPDGLSRFVVVDVVVVDPTSAPRRLSVLAPAWVSSTTTTTSTSTSRMGHGNSEVSELVSSPHGGL
jgi:hypothetical protein